MAIRTSRKGAGTQVPITTEYTTILITHLVFIGCAPNRANQTAIPINNLHGRVISSRDAYTIKIRGRMWYIVSTP